MLGAEDGFGGPVRRAGSRGYPNAGEGRGPQAIYSTHYAPLPRWPWRQSLVL